MIKELHKELYYVQFNGDMVHGMWRPVIKIGGISIKEESKRTVLVINAKFFIWDFQLKEQQIALQVFYRGYYEFDKKNYDVKELYKCFIDLIEEIKAFNKRAQFGEYNPVQPTFDEFSKEVYKVITQDM